MVSGMHLRSLAKNSYGRGVGTIPGCPDGWILVKSSSTNWGDACWPPCPSGKLQTLSLITPFLCPLGFSDEQYFTCWLDVLLVLSVVTVRRYASPATATQCRLPVRASGTHINQCSYANDPNQCKNLDVNRNNLNAALQQLDWPYCNATTSAIAKKS